MRAGDALERHHETLERICRRGCRSVTGLIAEMEAGGVPAELADLGRAERDAVLAELKAIMAVYDGECGVAGDAA